MRKAIKFGLLLGGLVGIAPNLAHAQAVRVGRQAVTPQTAVSSLTVTATPASVSFHLVPNGVATGSSAVTLTTTWGWGLCLPTCTITLYGYFVNASAALSGGSPVVNISSSEVLGLVPTGTYTTYTPFNQSSPMDGSGGSLQLFQQTINFLGTLGGSRADSLSLEINLANQPQLPAGTYSGTLYIQAQSL